MIDRQTDFLIIFAYERCRPTAHFFFLWVLFVLVVLTGCEEPGNVGSGLTDEDQLDVRTIDTLTVQSSTVFLDTVNTQGADRLLAGAYTDEYLGRIQTTSFFRLSLPGVFSVSGDARYDSLTLRIASDYHYGEADQRQQLRVHRVTEEITPEDDEDPLYNSDRFAYQELPLGERTFIPEETDSLEITISDQLGEELFNAAHNGEEIAEENDEFQQFLKGLALVGSYDTNSAVTGFEAGSTGDIELRLYYRESDNTGGILEEKQFTFQLEPGSAFSHITSQRPAPLDQLTASNDVLMSRETEERTYVQNGVGLITRLTFPTLKELFNVVERNFFLVSADLYLFPIAGTYGEETPLPASLQLNVADEHNRSIGYLTDASGTIQRSSPTVDEEFNKNTYYHFNVTSFIQNELDTEAHTGYGLLVMPAYEDYRSRIDRLVLGSDQNREFDMYLQLIISEFKF